VFPRRYGLSVLSTDCICVFRVVLTINSDCLTKQHYRFGFLSTDSVCVFRIVLTINSDFFPKEHSPVGLCIEGAIRGAPK
jgi:hypothetical protein